MLSTRPSNNDRDESVRPIGTFRTVVAGVAILASLAGCGMGTAPSRSIEIPDSGSGVTGTVVFAPAGRNTAVTISVEPAGNLDMPAHIHPGTCDKMVPQPKFLLVSVKDGSSATIVPATIDELFAGGLALNTHKSNDEMKVSTACVDIK